MSETPLEIRSAHAECTWPALPSQPAALLLALLYQLERTQWWPADRLLEHQLSQLRVLLGHARDSVPFYRDRLDMAGLRAGGDLTLDAWRTLPLLTRREVQNAGEALASRAVPAAFGPVTSSQTSGSTGEPVRLRKTAVDQLLWEAITLREHEWHGRDLTGKLAGIRVYTEGAAAPPHGVVLDSWGPPASLVCVTGPMVLLSLSTDIDTQVQWLKRHEPDYLLTYPTNLAALIARFAQRGERPRRLREVRTVGETLTPALRAACRDAWDVPIIDLYSSQEIGYIALQCPASGQYHVMAESVLVEVLDNDGAPCRPGEIGRLVVTSLHNFATPLIRYELRDYAEAGAPCPCGRGLPTLARILGRSRNMLKLPTGEQRWPLVGFDRYRDIAPVRQYQLIQHALDAIEVRLVTDRPLRADEEARLTEVIQEALGHPFRLAYTYLDGEIPRGPGGKFEEFISRLEA